MGKKHDKDEKIRKEFLKRLKDKDPLAREVANKIYQDRHKN